MKLIYQGDLGFTTKNKHNLVNFLDLINVPPTQLPDLPDLFQGTSIDIEFKKEVLDLDKGFCIDLKVGDFDESLIHEEQQFSGHNVHYSIKNRKFVGEFSLIRPLVAKKFKNILANSSLKNNLLLSKINEENIGYLLGNSKNNDVNFFGGPSIYKTQEGVYLFDFGSYYGTLVNGNKIGALNSETIKMLQQYDMEARSLIGNKRRNRDPLYKIHLNEEGKLSIIVGDRSLSKNLIVHGNQGLVKLNSGDEIVIAKQHYNDSLKFTFEK